MEGKVVVYKDQGELAERFTEALMERIAAAREGRFDLAISGGSTPQIVFSALAAKYADSPLWQKTHFWWVDERMVPPDHPESNFGVANRLLFSKIRIPEKNIHRIRGENEPYQEANSYAQQIKAEVPAQSCLPENAIRSAHFDRLENSEVPAHDSQSTNPDAPAFNGRPTNPEEPAHNSRPVFDLIILGLGNDGHTASIFPDQMELLDSELICAVAHHPVSGQARVTLTGKQINHAFEICFLVTGTSKAEKLSDIAQNGTKASLLPAAHIYPVNGILSWYCDAAAVEFVL